MNSTQQSARGADTFRLSYFTLRSVASPEDNEAGRKRYCGVTRATNLFGLNWDENVRSYLGQDEEGRKRKSTLVNLAIRETLDKNPDLFPILNTGVVGGMVRGQKITVRDSVRILEMIAKDAIRWAKDEFWGYEVPVEIPGVDVERFDLSSYYDEEQIEELSQNLKSERIDWLTQFPGLNRDILQALNP